MSARRRALRSERVNAAGERDLRLGQRGHGADDGDACLAQPQALLGARHAERERRDVRPQVQQHLDLGRPVVVVEPRFTELGAVALGLRGQAPWRSARCPPGVPALGCGANRFAPIGPEDSPRAAASRSANTSAVR